MRRIQSSDNFAASKNPRARSIRVSAPAIACVIAKAGAKVIRGGAEFLEARGGVVDFGDERVED